MPNNESNKPIAPKKTVTPSVPKTGQVNVPKNPSPVNTSPKTPIKPSVNNLNPTKPSVKPTGVNSTKPSVSADNKPNGNMPPIENAKPLPTKKTVSKKETPSISNLINTKKSSSVDKSGKPIVKEIGKENINKNIAKEENVEGEKKKKKRIFLIIFFIFLILAVIATVIILVLRVKESDLRFKIIVNADVQTTITGIDNQTKTLVYFPGDLMEGEMAINIQNEKGAIASDESVFLRFKIEAFVDDNYYAGLFKPQFKREDMWYGDDEESPDGYFYYMERCHGNDTINVFDYLEFVGNVNNNILNGKQAKIMFTVEILEGNYSAIGQEWFTAPDGWRTAI